MSWEPPRSPLDPVVEEVPAPEAAPKSWWPPEGDKRRNLILAATVAVSLLIAAALATRDSSGGSADELAAAGLTALQARDYETARELYGKAAKKDPENKFAQYNLGFIAHTVDNDNVAAERYYRRAIDLDPVFPQPLYNLGLLRELAGDNDEAIALYRRAVTALPDFASAHYHLGLLLRQRPGSEAEAEAELALAVKQDPALAQLIPPTTAAGGDEAG